MANPYTIQGAISIDSTVDLIVAGMDLVWMRENKVETALGQFFDKQSIGAGLSYSISNVGSETQLPEINDDLADLPYAVPAQGYNKTFTLKEYRLGIRVTETMLKADRHARVAGMTTGLIKGAFRRDEYARAGIFNNAFTGDAGSDSKDLCDDDHPNVNSDTGTWDNKTTGAMTGATLQAAHLLARKMTDARGMPAPVMPQILLVPPELKETAQRLITSDKRAEDALNGDTVIIDGLRVVDSPYLSSTTAFFLVGDLSGESKGLHEISLTDWNIADNSPANVDIKIDKRVKAVKEIGFTCSKNLIGSTGA